MFFKRYDASDRSTLNQSVYLDAGSLDRPTPKLTQLSAKSLNARFFRRASSSKSLGSLFPGDEESERGSVGKKSPDWFSFRLRETSRVSLDVTINELISRRYIQGSILDSDRDSLKKTDRVKAPFGSDDISLKLRPGTYHVKITTNGKKIFYRFELSVDD